MRFWQWLFMTSTIPHELSPQERDNEQSKILLQAQADQLEVRLKELHHQRDRRIFRRRADDRLEAK